ncbi:MAG TPA: sigma-70 family RNA polymerase sigma factor, partial [Vicinamibacteria bacterium]
MEDAAGIRAGDQEAFRLLVERHSHALFRLAYRMTGNEHDAEDVVQEALVKAYRGLDRFEERAEVGTWLYRITSNCAFDLLRSRQRRGR